MAQNWSNTDWDDWAGWDENDWSNDWGQNENSESMNPYTESDPRGKRS